MRMDLQAKDPNVDGEKITSIDVGVPETITNKDLRRSWRRWHLANEMPHAFDRYLAASLTFALMPTLKKLYKNKDDLIAAYKRHLLFYNTQATWGGGTIIGIVTSLEEQKAHDLDSISEDAIYGVKAGLMGAMAGIGDSIDSGVIQYILIALALPWAYDGSIFGVLLPFILFAGYQFIIGQFFTRMGYRLGKQAATELVAGARTKSIINILSIVGLFMMGILAANYVKITSTLKWTVGNNAFKLQSILDSILPGILPLIAVMGCYFYFQKRQFNVLRAILGLTVILAALAIVGIL
ncbi:PTS system, mannose-specific IID component [Lacticaseibacillus paracasei NRIC 0644]|uniref:PTS system, mannose-specific IID component n=2 Tax=Lacticaseibacillus paracasei TaxID=1597 RepID=A0A0C9NUT6_LACPA|nr:PTS system, mannose-specific IID component [Lacticaseibacillus paracasei NRIC 0644]